ncbi:SIMPL domain-containing protein [Mycobacterium sp. M1]|uniref:SIMPL domain-containing protein n=1 Tax=Mycolicibacter acidiphilus TaxID=2835306 RepID=A0ABS5RI17_9MYCO|nr:SIMPL domain-containing protein [Mycolicibacter acidiphilus]MBS9533198.1 SIMPL domain-containing protein [Mycolicibacter acidiphilus]
MASARNFRMALRWSTMLAATGLAVVAIAGCDAPPAGPEQPRQVTVVGSGEVQGVPDTLTTEAGIEFVASDVTAAMNQTSERLQAVIDALLDAGVDRKDISTTQVSLQPQYGSPEIAGGAPAITGYRAGNTIRVKVEPASASQVLTVIARVGGDATRISGVSYSIEDDSQLVHDARERAFNDARDRAEQYAQLSGLHLGRVISISEVSGGSAPQPVSVGTPAPRAAMAAPVPVEPGQQTVSFSVTAVWELN